MRRILLRQLLATTTYNFVFVLPKRDRATLTR